jgi:heat-inducible transcriptional repressor
MSARQRDVLRMVVKLFVETAGPVGSTALKERFDLGWSSATIRNTMSDLEGMGFLMHPHTSAGRVPTDLGYRAFVAELMDATVLEQQERAYLQAELAALQEDTETLIRESSRLLAQLAQLLGVVLSPRLKNGVLQRLDIVPVSSGRLLFVVNVEGGYIRTIVLQAGSDLKTEQLGRLIQLLNERLAGLTLDEIRRTCVPRIQDLASDDMGIVQLILNRTADLFSDEPARRTVQFDGTPFMLSQPEFSDADHVRSLINLLDDRSHVIRLMEEEAQPLNGSALVRIGYRPESGSDHPGGSAISVVAAPYMVSNLRGTIGVIGPTRMNYARAVALVEGMATLMSLSDSRSHLA